MSDCFGEMVYKTEAVPKDETVSKQFYNLITVTVSDTRFTW